jgi:hypothetical protein
MKRLKIMGVCITAVCAVGLITGGAASAATYELTGLPELGRCVKLSTKTGLYKYKNCVALSEGSKGSFEWEPGPGEKPGFVAEAGEVKLETVAGVRVSCASGELNGSWQDGKTASVTVAFRGCASKERGCGADPSKPTEITNEGSPIEGELGFIEKGEKPKVGLDLKPKEGSSELLKFTCGGPPELTFPELWKIEGSVIGRIRYLDHMNQTFALLYQQTKGTSGKQNPQNFAEGVKDTPIANRLTEGGPLTEEAGLTLREEERRNWMPGDYEEPLEVKAK